MQIQRKDQAFPQQATFTAASLANPQTIIIPIDRDYYLYGVDVHFLGRLALGVAAAASINAEAPFNLFRRARWRINHELFGSKFLYNLMAATVYRRRHIFRGTAPVASGGLAVAIGNYDLDVHLWFPTPPEYV